MLKREKTMEKPIKGIARRDFVKSTALSCLAFSLPNMACSTFKGSAPVKIGLITDLHQDIMHDGVQRMQAFVEQVKVQQPHAIMQLGDFAYPGEKNKEVIQLFNNAHEQALHVIGNHDTDAGYTTDQCLSYWGMPARYYTKEVEGIHFIVLDGNEKGSPTHQGGYASYIGKEQQSWLVDQLKTIEGPIIIVSHQPLLGPLAVDNAEEIQSILSAAKGKILFAINGHTHIDMLLEKDGIPYLHLNSASYLWVGGDYQHQSYSEKIHEDHPWISYTCPYKDSLFAFMTIDPETRTVTLTGKKSEWQGESPAELGVDNYPTLAIGDEIVPSISNRKILKPKG